MLQNLKRQRFEIGEVKHAQLSFSLCVGLAKRGHELCDGGDIRRGARKIGQALGAGKQTEAPLQAPLEEALSQILESRRSTTPRR